MTLSIESIERPVAYMPPITLPMLVPATTSTYGTVATNAWTIDLQVEDCSLSDTDSVKVTVTCEGVKP